MFIDEVQIKVISGKGGDGLISWRREKYIPKGGPWGGDGGKGGDVYLQTDVNLNTLSEFRNKKVLKAEKGEGGGTNTKHGLNAPDLIIKVPVGTIVKDANSGELIADLDENNIKILIVKGGRGGFGNAHFCSSVRQAPAFAELGDISLEKDLLLELKLVADIGIIGVPSAGKSSLISKITNVKAKVGDYPFTTLTPNLGVLDHKGKSLVLEDVPGLIPGASEGKGLGIEFLKHIERTGTILHMLDLYRLDKVFTDYEDIRKELEYFSPELAKKKEIIVFSKSDLLDEEMQKHIVEEFMKKIGNPPALISQEQTSPQPSPLRGEGVATTTNGPLNTDNYFTISSATGVGLDQLKDYLIDNFAKEKVETENEVEEIKIYDLKDHVDPKKVDLRYIGDYKFEARGLRIEEIVRMTDFTNIEAVARVYDVLEKMGVMKKMEKKLEQVSGEKEIDNSGFFEGNETSEFAPKVIIADKEIPLDKLRYNL